VRTRPTLFAKTRIPVTQRKTPPGDYPAARRERWWEGLGFDGIRALAAFAFLGYRILSGEGVSMPYEPPRECRRSCHSQTHGIFL